MLFVAQKFSFSKEVTAIQAKRLKGHDSQVCEPGIRKEGTSIQGESLTGLGNYLCEPCIGQSRPYRVRRGCRETKGIE
jgi:hypothetical protein